MFKTIKCQLNVCIQRDISQCTCSLTKLNFIETCVQFGKFNCNIRMLPYRVNNAIFNNTKIVPLVSRVYASMETDY